LQTPTAVAKPRSRASCSPSARVVCLKKGKGKWICRPHSCLTFSVYWSNGHGWPQDLKI